MYYWQQHSFVFLNEQLMSEQKVVWKEYATSAFPHLLLTLLHQAITCIESCKTSHVERLKHTQKRKKKQKHTQSIKTQVTKLLMVTGSVPVHRTLVNCKGLRLLHKYPMQLGRLAYNTLKKWDSNTCMLHHNQKYCERFVTHHRNEKGSKKMIQNAMLHHTNKCVTLNVKKKHSVQGHNY